SLTTSGGRSTSVTSSTRRVGEQAARAARRTRRVRCMRMLTGAGGRRTGHGSEATTAARPEEAFRRLPAPVLGPHPVGEARDAPDRLGDVLEGVGIGAAE